MKAGDVVMVYEDPIAKTRPEGCARLVEEIRPDVGDGLAIWLVEFLDDPCYTGQMFHRVVAVR